MERFARDLLPIASIALALASCCACPQTRQKPKYVKKPLENWAIADDEHRLDEFIPPVNALGAAGQQDMIRARFAGTARKKAKTSIASGSTTSFDSLEDFMATLPRDEDMLGLHISTAPTSGRVPQEQRNVEFPAWVYAIKWEEDHDWHLIVGSDPDQSPIVYFNIEIGGLPPTNAPDYSALLAAREDLSEVLDGDLPGSGGYYEYEPFEVSITGSLFYDASHAAGVVGPVGLRPKTAWEVHPVTNFEWR